MHNALINLISVSVGKTFRRCMEMLTPYIFSFVGFSVISDTRVVDALKSLNYPPDWVTSCDNVASHARHQRQ